VYTHSGPVDPLPFVNKTIQTASDVPAKSLAASLKLIKSKKIGDSLLKANTVLIPLAVTSKAYIVELSNGRQIQIPFDDVKAVKQTEKPMSDLATKPSVASKKS
jgi:hypothetical protein